MPNIKGKAAKTPEGRKKNIEIEMAAGKPLKQAIAISYSLAGEKKKVRSKVKKSVEGKK